MRVGTQSIVAGDGTRPDMTKIYFFGVDVREMGTDTLYWISKAAKALDTGESSRDLVLGAKRGDFQIWRIAGAANGVFITQIRLWPARRELLIYSVAGAGLVRHKEEIIENFKTIARVWHCDGIIWQSSNKRLAELYLALGAEAVATVFRMEV